MYLPYNCIKPVLIFIVQLLWLRYMYVSLVAALTAGRKIWKSSCFGLTLYRLIQLYFYISGYQFQLLSLPESLLTKKLSCLSCKSKKNTLMILFISIATGKIMKTLRLIKLNIMCHSRYHLTHLSSIKSYISIIVVVMHNI